MQTTFKNNLIDIEKELSAYHRSKDKLLRIYVENRLYESLQSYYKELNNSYIYLQGRNLMKVAKKLNKDA